MDPLLYTKNQLETNTAIGNNRVKTDFSGHDHSSDEERHMKLPTATSTYEMMLGKERRAYNRFKQDQALQAKSDALLQGSTVKSPTHPGSAEDQQQNQHNEQYANGGQKSSPRNRTYGSLTTATTVCSTVVPSETEDTPQSGVTAVLVSESAPVPLGQDPSSMTVSMTSSKQRPVPPPTIDCGSADRLIEGTDAAPESYLQLTATGTNGGKNEVHLYDRDSELSILREEYTAMVKRARNAATAKSPLRHRKSTPVICVAGKAGTGKTALVRAFMKQESETAAAVSEAAAATSPTAITDRTPFFLLGKFDWPTTSVMSCLKARPHVPNSASMSSEFADDTQYQPALAQEVNQEQDRQHEPYSAFVMAFEHLLEQIEARGPTVTDRLRSRILQAIGGPSSIPVLGELTPKFATFLQQRPFDETHTANEELSAEGEKGGMGAVATPEAAPFLSPHNGDTNLPYSPSPVVGRPPSTVVAASSSTAAGVSHEGHPSYAATPSATDNTVNAASNSSASGKTVRVEHRIPRLKYVLRQLLRGLCHHNRNPCVLILDDAQWADLESLELARDLHSDSENPLFLLVLTWRTNDIHEEESCYTAMGSSIGIFANDSVSRVNLNNLSHPAVTQWVAQTLQRQTTDVMALTKAVHHKTSGNPLFVRLFLEYLERENYLKWSTASKMWLWDEMRISALNISQNFLGLIVAKILRLPTPSRVVLQIVACLGQSFDEENVCTIIDKLDTSEMFDVNISHNDAMGCFDGLIRAGLLERHGVSTTSFTLRTTFAHDQMQEAAYQLIPKHSRQLIQLRIGERLLEIMEEQRSEYVSFLGIDLCSNGIGFLSTKERMGLGLYNLLAGEKCLARASYATALAYFEFGLSSLRINDFLKGRLSLELSFGAMEAAFGVDDFDKVRLHYDRITGSGTTPEDNLRAHVLLIRATGTRGNTKDALTTGFSVLRSMGIKTVVDMSNKVSLFVHMTKTKIALRKHNEESLSYLREMTGTKVRHGMKIVEAMLPFAYEHDRQLFMCLSMKIVRWSVKYGVTSQSPLVFAALGSSPFFQSKDMRLATALGNAALRLMQRFGTRENAGLIKFVVHSQILGWTSEPQIVQRSLESTSRSSFGGGDLLPGFWSLAVSYAMSFDCGSKRLDELEMLGEAYSLQMKQGSCPIVAGVHDATWQMAVHLRGDKMEVKEVRMDSRNGAMTQDEALSYGNEILEFAFLSRELQLAYFLGDHNRGEKARKRCETTLRSVASSPHLILHYSFSALNCLMLCSSNNAEPVRKNAYYKAANHHLVKLNHWQKDFGYRFGGHLVKLIQAELSRVEGKYSLAEKNYQGAVWIAGRQGNQRDKGLTHELAGRFFIRDRKDETWAAYHFDQALQAYHAWGGRLLVNRLLEKYGDVVSRDSGRSEVSSQLLSAQSHDSSVV